MTTAYRFIEVSLATRSCQAQEDFWVKMFGAKVIFRGNMASQRFTRMLVCGITLIFREDPELALPPGLGEERQFRQHLGLRVDDLERSIAELQAKGAQFAMTPAMVREAQKMKLQGSGKPYLETDFIAGPLTRERITAGEFRHDVAIFVAPDNLWIELNEIQEPQDTQWYPPMLEEAR
jgi:catechol 2,3-dioxygenase-like lactoylglutathione lyase family enzyme